MYGTKHQATWSAVAGELFIVGCAAAIYGGVRAVTEGSAAQAVANAEAVDRIERSLGVAWEGTAQSLIAGSDSLVTLANWVYIWGHWPVIIGACAFFCVSVGGLGVVGDSVSEVDA